MMAEKEHLQGSETETPAVDYAFWEDTGWDGSGAAFQVVYSLQLFHEIDFVVNEGYRKIPHGGIEEAGLLFGWVRKNEVRIEAFRPIECEHASGPSLNFSERDLAKLEEQIKSSAKDPDLERFQPVGWFLGHTRAPLELTEAEAKQFDRFFPEPCRVTVLVKPERFQPTRFGFLVRRPNGEIAAEATSTAIILPLPGRSFKPGQLIPSLPAPKPIVSAKRTTPAAIREQPEDSGDAALSSRPRPSAEGPAKLRQKTAEPDLASIWKIPPEGEGESESKESGETAEGEPLSPEKKEERRKLARERARKIEEAYPVPAQAPAQTRVASPIAAAAPPPAAAPAPTPFRPAALPSLPRNAARPLYPAYDRLPVSAPEEDLGVETAMLNSRSVTALALAALLGCLVGYMAYLQLPAPIIPIDVRPLAQMVVVSWPPDETRNAVYAAIRVNDGPPVPLSVQEKTQGQVALTAPKDFKVEVVARNWIRDSRGIVRYLHSNVGNTRVVPEGVPPGR
jgi:hypothetical protein